MELTLAFPNHVGFSSLTAYQFPQFDLRNVVGTIKNKPVAVCIVASTSSSDSRQCNFGKVIFVTAH
jgi:hypothetical protein